MEKPSDWEEIVTHRIDVYNRPVHGVNQDVRVRYSNGPSELYVVGSGFMSLPIFMADDQCEHPTGVTAEALLAVVAHHVEKHRGLSEYSRVALDHVRFALQALQAKRVEDDNSARASKATMNYFSGE